MILRDKSLTSGKLGDDVLPFTNINKYRAMVIILGNLGKSSY